MKIFHQWLDQTTMYKVVLYALFSYVFFAYALVLAGVSAFSLTELTLSLLVYSIPALVTHYAYRYLSGAPANIESTIITILILWLVFLPTDGTFDLGIYALISFMTIASKYVLAYRKLHIFNPVALGVVLASWFSLAYAGWWVGNAWMIGPVALGGVANYSQNSTGGFGN